LKNHIIKNYQFELRVLAHPYLFIYYVMKLFTVKKKRKILHIGRSVEQAWEV